MKTNSLLGCNAQLALWSAISALLAMRAALERRWFARAVERVAGGTVFHHSTVARFETIRSSEAG